MAALSPKLRTSAGSTTTLLRPVRVDALAVHLSIALRTGSAVFSVRVFDPRCQRPVVGVTVDFVIPTLFGPLTRTGVTDVTGSASSVVTLGPVPLLIAGTIYLAQTQPTAVFAGARAFGQILR